MLRYLFRNQEGKYLNTDYHSRWRNGIWRDKSDARIYKSRRGISSAFNSITPAVVAVIGPRPTGKGWSPECSAWYKKFSKLPLDIKFELWAKDGYVLEPIEI